MGGPADVDHDLDILLGGGGGRYKSLGGVGPVWPGTH